MGLGSGHPASVPGIKCTTVEGLNLLRKLIKLLQGVVATDTDLGQEEVGKLPLN